MFSHSEQPIWSMCQLLATQLLNQASSTEVQLPIPQNTIKDEAWSSSTKVQLRVRRQVISISSRCWAQLACSTDLIHFLFSASSQWPHPKEPSLNYCLSSLKVQTMKPVEPSLPTQRKTFPETSSQKSWREAFKVTCSECKREKASE